ncbi:uncharacterized protein EMH_0092910 [Eimeria mitis]|uniref:Uncharacterized protein n=1 Tax=Eimeria mitis TaxID=44415 RepID=U6KH73_9EIME|nr:uncharacterized protein EMH_0092910 [Eimeria mitis]CDJ34808.1 hypothetical protein EMH_0092910 [Eimeria mitis]
MWDKVARVLLQDPEVPNITKRFWSGIPPPVEVGDIVRVLETGSTIVQRGEYQVVGVQGDEYIVEKDGERTNVPRDRLLLTIKEKICLEDMEEIFELAGVRDAFQKTLETGDPRYLQAAMKASESFHSMRQLPGIKASPLQEPGKERRKPDPAEMSNIYTSDSAVKVCERMGEDEKRLVAAGYVRA